MENNLSELWRQAEQFGLVRLYTYDDGTYNCTIVFSTIKHVKLEAQSSFSCKTPEVAVQEAIEKAAEIVASLSSGMEDFAKKPEVQSFIKRLIKREEKYA